ncbi:hypothetical protein MVES1_001634 [Malassezia vespertilionis]|uniref:uncharacterized protein n=1 Tax=Malassezia vespertilionis TaxID=2020962 RepID=UPI0024B20BB6|nr:uncharacterized protein MVES1_001634 [Malassezia vespertilionis]WFD06289.1 hypothetical protein MVES1_001634 [Malassezia vespertilionis]
MKSPDSDFRYMALNDLVSVVSHESYAYHPLEEKLESAAVQQTLDLLKDKNTEVKNLTVKTLGTLSTHVRDANYTVIITSLTNLVLGEGEEERDIASLALRTVMQEIGENSPRAQIAVQTVIPAFVGQVQSASVNAAQRISAMDVLNDTVSHFPMCLARQIPLQYLILDTLLGALQGRMAMCKRAIQGLGMLAVECTPEAYAKILNDGLAGLKGSREQVRVSVQLLGLLARETLMRLRPSSPEYAQQVVQLLRSLGDQPDEEADELRELCLQTLTSLFTYSIIPGSIDVHPLVELDLLLLKHDPNAADYNDEEEVEEDEDDLLDEQYSDDDDLSWKVRRAACKQLASLFQHHLDAVRQMAYTITSALTARFGEREENVRLEIYSTFTLFLLRLAGDPEVNALQKRKHDASELALPCPDAAPLLDLLPAAVRSLCAQANTGSAVTQIACLDTLAQLVLVFGGGMAQHSDAILHSIRRVLQGGKDAAGGRSRTLAAVALFSELAAAAPKETARQLDYVVHVFSEASFSKQHRTALEGMRATALLISSVVPVLGAQAIQPQLMRLYQVAIDVMQRAEEDQSLREASLATLGLLLSLGASALEDALPVALDTLKARLQHEVLRPAALAVTLDVLQSADRQGLYWDAFAGGCLPILIGLAKNAHKHNGLLALECLQAAISLLREQMPVQDRTAIVQLLATIPLQIESPALAPALALADVLVEVDPTLARAVADALLPPLLPLLGSPVLAPKAVDALTVLLRSLAAAEDALAPALVSSLERAWETQSAGQLHNVPVPLAFARCLGAAASTSAALPSVLGRVSEMVGAVDSAGQSLALYTLGVLGQQGTLCGWPNASSTFARILAAPESAGRSFALGGMLLGDAQFLALVQARLDQEPLQTLRIFRDALAIASHEQLKHMSHTLWPAIFALGMPEEVDDAGQVALDVCSECVARMVFTEPPTLLAELEREVNSPLASRRAMVLGAVRTMVTLDRAHALDESLSPALWYFLQLLSDQHLLVRRNAVMALHAALYNRPDLVKAHLGMLLPKLFQATVVREDLKRKVAMGPFTVIQDDGLDLRKNALETIFTLLDNSFEQVHVPDVAKCAVQTLSDDDGIKLLGCLIIVRLVDLVPGQIAPFLSDMVGPLRTILTRKTRDGATKQEIEKATELTHAALRVLAKLGTTCEVSAYPDFNELLSQTQQSPHGALLAKLVV